MRTELRLPATAAACLSAALLSGCHQDMAYQPSYHAQDAQEVKEAGTLVSLPSARDYVAGSVHRGNLRDDEVLFTGKKSVKGADGRVTKVESAEFPMTITEEILKRGQARFAVNCLPCHGYLGDGNGMVTQRGLVGPANFHSDRLTTSPAGHYFDVITNGYGRMLGQEHIHVRDRWAIIAYIRALQLSQNGALADVPEADRKALLALKTDTQSTGPAGMTTPAANAHAAAAPAPQGSH